MNWNKSIDRSYCLTLKWFTSIYSVRAWSWPSCTHTASYLGIFHYRGFFLYFIKTRSWFIINIAITLFINVLSNMVLSIFTLYFSICRQCIEIDEKRPLKMVKSNSSIECAETKINKWSFLYHFYDLYRWNLLSHPLLCYDRYLMVVPLFPSVTLKSVSTLPKSNLL